MNTKCCRPCGFTMGAKNFIKIFVTTLYFYKNEEYTVLVRYKTHYKGDQYHDRYLQRHPHQ